MTRLCFTDGYSGTFCDISRRRLEALQRLREKAQAQRRLHVESGKQDLERLAEAEHASGLEQYDPLEIFYNADYHSTNLNEFKSKTLDGFKALGATDEDVKQLKINFREGSVITEVDAPLERLTRLRALQLRRLKVNGKKNKISRCSH